MIIMKRLCLYDSIQQDMLKNNWQLVEALNSAQIEGANTTYADTLKIVEGRAEIKSKSEKMVINMYNVLELINSMQSFYLTREDLMKIWKTVVDGVCENIELWEEGIYRKGDIGVFDYTGKKIHTGTSASILNEVMDEYIENYNHVYKDREKSLIISFMLHYILVYIHPFCDGNGRMARLLNNNYLIQAGWDKFRWFSISSAINRTRNEYYKSIDFSNNKYGDITFFVKYMLKSVSSLMRLIKEGGAE